MKREKDENWNSLFIKMLSAKPIAFNPVFAKVSKSANAGLLMSQLLYWWEAGHVKGWIFKTIEELEEETCLTRGEQDTAIKKWSTLGVLEKKLMQVPPKRFFKINTDKLFNLCKTAISDVERNKIDRNIAQIITESTSLTKKTQRENWLRSNFSKKVDVV